MANHWLMKSEPEAFSWDDLVRLGKTVWDGVRNYEARNNLRAMRRGDRALFYHSVTGKEIVGIMKVSRVAFPDPTASEGDWSAVEVVPVRPLRHPVPLAYIKTDARLAELLLVRRSRISVVPVSPEHFAYLVRLGARPR